MIELPRAALTADEIGAFADFFSFGTNDLTQTTFGFSRDDIEAKFLPKYLERKILARNPFETVDPGVAQLVEMGCERGRTANAGSSSASAANTAETLSRSRCSSTSDSTTCPARRTAYRLPASLPLRRFSRPRRKRRTTARPRDTQAPAVATAVGAASFFEGEAREGYQALAGGRFAHHPGAVTAPASRVAAVVACVGRGLSWSRSVSCFAPAGRWVALGGVWPFFSVRLLGAVIGVQVSRSMGWRFPLLWGAVVGVLGAAVLLVAGRAVRHDRIVLAPRSPTRAPTS